MNRLGSGSRLDPDSIRSVNPDGGMQQDQHCRHYEHAGTYRYLSSKAWTDQSGAAMWIVEYALFWIWSAPVLLPSRTQTFFFVQIEKSANYFSYTRLKISPWKYINIKFQCWRYMTFWCGSPGSAFLFCKHYFSLLNTFMRKGKDPDLEPDPYLWLMDPDPGGPKICGFGSPRLLSSCLIYRTST